MSADLVGLARAIAELYPPEQRAEVGERLVRQAGAATEKYERRAVVRALGAALTKAIDLCRSDSPDLEAARSSIDLLRGALFAASCATGIPLAQFGRLPEEPSGGACAPGKSPFWTAVFYRGLEALPGHRAESVIEYAWKLANQAETRALLEQAQLEIARLRDEGLVVDRVDDPQLPLPGAALPSGDVA